MTPPEISYAVILTRGAERASVALESIDAQAPSSELLLVLNDADEPMRALAAEWVARGARVLHDGVDLGVMLAYNVALRAAEGTVVCTVHEDSELQPGCLDRLLTTLRERPEAAAVGPRVDTPSAVGADAGLLWSDGATSGVPVGDVGDLIAVDYVGSHCMLLRREAVADVGGFDVRFFPAIYGDVDLCLRLWDAGWTVLCERRARNVHRTGAMVDPARGPRRGPQFRAFLLERNRVRFRAEHAARLAEQPARADLHDASRPSPEEIATVLALAEARRRRVTAPPHGAGTGAVEVPDDLDAYAREHRRGFEDEFLQHLIEREADLAAEAAGLHAAYAGLHAEHVALAEDAAGAHRAYAILHAEHDLFRRSYEELHAELDAARIALSAQATKATAR